MTTIRSLQYATSFALALLAIACGGAGESGGAGRDVAELDAATACSALNQTPAQIAVLDFITTAEPKPWRFLNAVSTDSALSESAFEVVQKKGPTFYWLTDDKSQQQIREKLSNDGDWATMLVLMREDTDHGDGTYTLRIGGRYVGAPHEGLESPEKRYNVKCQVDSAPAWVISNGSDSNGL
jgi:hypothetical protein